MCIRARVCMSVRGEVSRKPVINKKPVPMRLHSSFAPTTNTSVRIPYTSVNQALIFSTPFQGLIKCNTFYKYFRCDNKIHNTLISNKTRKISAHITNHIIQDNNIIIYVITVYFKN